MVDTAPAVTAVVVNYNAGPLLADCVRALLESPARPDVEVVDNASVDDSMARLEAEFDGHPALLLQRNKNNLGFARAVNAVARSARAEYFLVINPDCILQEGALGQLLGAMEENGRVGLAGPLVRDGTGAVERACLRRFPRPLNSLVTMLGLWRLGAWIPGLKGVSVPGAALQEQPVEAEATSGACMLFRRAALAEIGYFDEGYELHCEDLDVMFRLKEANWHCVFVPTAQATHFQGVPSRSRPFWVHWQKHRGMLRFYRKLLSRDYPVPVSLLVAFGIWVHFALLLPVVWLRK